LRCCEIITQVNDFDAQIYTSPLLNLLTLVSKAPFNVLNRSGGGIPAHVLEGSIGTNLTQYIRTKLNLIYP
jgi:hypothetical protein